MEEVRIREVVGAVRNKYSGSIENRTLEEHHFPLARYFAMCSLAQDKHFRMPWSLMGDSTECEPEDVG